MKTYKKLCTEFYDLDPKIHRDGTVYMDFYMERARQASGLILEPMCGTGRFLIPMLQEGLAVEGFDASSHMLDALRQKWAMLSSTPPPVWQQFVQDFVSPKRYKLIFVPFGSWGLITDIQESKVCLQNMYDHLAPDGKFIIEIETIASVPQPCEIWRRGVNKRADGSSIAINAFATYDEHTQLYKSLCRYESIGDGVIKEVENEDFLMYLYGFNEMDALLREVGFTDIKKYQDYLLASATNEDAHILIYECVR